MTISVGVGGAWKGIPAIKVGVDGAWKLVTHAWVGVGGAWKSAYAALTATGINVSKLSEGAATSGTVTSDSTPAVSVSGGSGSYTYSWAHDSTSSGNTPTIISGGTTASPRFRATVQDAAESISAWTVTVTDATYGNSATASISVQLTWVDNRTP